jgi:hypothetical protein
MKTTEFLLSVHEQQTTLINLSTELFAETKNLMISEHYSIISENQNFGGRVKNAISWLLKKIGEIIISIKNWVTNQLGKFLKYIGALIHNMKSRYGKRGFNRAKTIESDVDLESLIALDITSHGSYVNLLAEYEKMNTARSKEDFNILKTNIDRHISELKTFFEDGKKALNVKKTYNGGDVEKLLNLMLNAKGSIVNVEESMLEMKKSMEDIKKYIERLQEEDFMYLIGTYAIHVHTEVMNLNSMMLSQLALGINKARDIIVELAK